MGWGDHIRTNLRWLAVAALALAVACGDDAEPEDAGTTDSGRVDTGVDAGSVDTGVDAGSEDTGVVEDSGVIEDSGVLPDVGFDAGVEPDAGFDAGVEPDAGFAPSCDDGIRNQDELWIDCGGVCANPCPACPGTGNLLRNPSFETVPNNALGQGILPSEWIPLVVTPDTYSTDGSYGVLPAANGNFTGVEAYDGIRWVAAWNNAGERFGQVLTSSLTVGAQYRITAHLHQALRGDLNNPGAYEIGLQNMTGTSTIGLARWTDTSSNAWVERSAEFFAPSESTQLPIMLFRAVGGGAYPGLDAVELIQTSSCP